MQAEFLQVKIDIIPFAREEQAVHDLALVRARKYAVSEAELLSSIDEVDRLRLFEKLGLPNISQYCKRYLGLSDTMTGFFVVVARKSRSVPELKNAIEQGDFSVSTAVQVASVITEENQTEWVAKAKDLTKHQLEKEVAKANPKRKKRPRIKPVGEDRNRFDFEGSDKLVEFLRRAQDLESQRTSGAATVEDTLIAALEVYLERRDPVRKAERVGKKRQAGLDFSQEKPAGNRPPVSAEMRHAINLRDRGRCQTALLGGERCGSSRWISFHHVIPLSCGGRHEVSNMVTVCGACHAKLHRDLDRARAEASERPMET